MVIALVAGLAASGCAPLPEIHPSFDAQELDTVYVFDTRNGTTRALDNVLFGGLAQQITGLRRFDFPALINRNIQDELVKRGYATTAQAGGAPAVFEKDAENPPYDAYVRSTIVAWSGSTQPPYHMDTSYRLEIFDARSGDRLYGGEFALRVKADKRRFADTSFLRDGIERSVRKAMRLLPSAD